MKSAIAILTYRRLGALQTMLQGISQHCASYPCAIFEDCGQRDGTAEFLQKGRFAVKRPELMATEYTCPKNSPDANYPDIQVFMGAKNLGVAKNSNRALKWFMDSDCDHLLLCNDDLQVTGDFVDIYAKAHRDLEVGHFCFCDFDKASPAISGAPETYKWTTYPYRGWKVKFLPRFTGIMLSFTREILEKVGYFDASFGAFGEEHSDMTIRCRLAGGVRLNRQDMNCLDVEHQALSHQEVQTSMPKGPERAKADYEASVAMREASSSYGYRHYYRPFMLEMPLKAGGGLPVRKLLDAGYGFVPQRM